MTRERVRKFGKASRTVQLGVLANLRATLADQSIAIEIAVIAIALSLLGSIFGPVKTIDFEGMNWVSIVIITLLSGAFLAIALLPAYGPQLVRNGRQQRARVWLAAYEDEIQRRRSRPEN